MAIVKLISYDQLYEVVSSIKTYIDNAVKNVAAVKLATARTLTIGNSGKSFDGSQDVSWSLSDIGAVNKVGDTMTGALTVKSSVTANYGFCVSNNNREGWFDVGDQDVYLHNDYSEMSLRLTHSGRLTYDDHEILHAENFSNYALSLGGGALTGSLSFPNDKYILSTDPNGVEKSILGITTSNNCVVGSTSSNLMLRSMNNDPKIKVKTDDGDTNYTLYHSGNHNLRSHAGQSVSKDDPLGPLYFQTTDSSTAPKQYVGRVTCAYSSDNDADYATLALYNASDSSSQNYINIYPGHIWTKTFYKSSASYIVLNDHKLQVTGTEPSNPSKGDIWIQI